MCLVREAKHICSVRPGGRISEHSITARSTKDPKKDGNFVDNTIYVRPFRNMRLHPTHDRIGTYSASPKKEDRPSTQPRPRLPIPPWTRCYPSLKDIDYGNAETDVVPHELDRRDDLPDVSSLPVTWISRDFQPFFLSPSKKILPRGFTALLGDVLTLPFFSR